MTSPSDILTSSCHGDVGHAVPNDAQHAQSDHADKAPESPSAWLVRTERPDEAVTELHLGEAIAVAKALHERGCAGPSRYGHSLSMPITTWATCCASGEGLPKPSIFICARSPLPPSIRKRESCLRLPTSGSASLTKPRKSIALGSQRSPTIPSR